MVAAYAVLAVVLGAAAVALLWSWSPVAAVLSAPVVASAGVLVLAALIVFMPQRSKLSRQGRMLHVE